MNTTKIKVPTRDELVCAVAKSCDQYRHNWLTFNDTEYQEAYKFIYKLATSLNISSNIYDFIMKECENCGYQPKFLLGDPITTDINIPYNEMDRENVIENLPKINKIISRCKDGGYYKSMKSDIFGTIIAAYEESGYKLVISDYKFNCDGLYFRIKFNPNIDSDELY